MKNILEAKDLDIYKRLLRVLGEYQKVSPGTGADRKFDQVISIGKKILPKDKQALAILDNILREDNPADTFQKLMNLRFSCLAAGCRPVVKKGRKHEVASWTRGGTVSDMVRDLLDWNEKGSGFWSDVEGNKVELVDWKKDDKKS